MQDKRIPKILSRGGDTFRHMFIPFRSMVLSIKTFLRQQSIKYHNQPEFQISFCQVKDDYHRNGIIGQVKRFASLLRSSTSSRNKYYK